MLKRLKVVSAIPKFTPGKLNGVAVPVWYMVPITFTLTGDPVTRPSRFEVTGTDTVYSEYKCNAFIYRWKRSPQEI